MSSPTRVPDDPLLCDFPLPLSATFYPMGFTLHIRTNSEHVLAAVEESWGPYTKSRNEPAIHLEIGVKAGASPERPKPVWPRARGPLASLIHGPDDFVICDSAKGAGFGWVTPAVVEDHPYFRWYFLDSAVYFLLTPMYLTPLHAGCVVLDGKGVLLTADSETGKTTLTYACARVGWTFVSDDASELLRSASDRRIIGRPHSIRFREPARDLFPELRDRVPARRPTGKWNIEVRTAELPGIRTASECDAHYLIFLNRSDPGPQRLQPFSRDEAFRRLTAQLCYGEEKIRLAQRHSIQTLLNIPVLELCYRDLDWAEQTLRRLVYEGFDEGSDSGAHERGDDARAGLVGDLDGRSSR